MNDILKQFTNDLATELKARLTSTETSEFIKATKASGDDRSFEVIMSTADEDRQGDALDQSRWDLEVLRDESGGFVGAQLPGLPDGVIDDIKTEGDQTIAGRAISRRKA